LSISITIVSLFQREKKDAPLGGKTRRQGPRQIGFHNRSAKKALVAGFATGH
jgi:hypothetical protein